MRSIGKATVSSMLALGMLAMPCRLAAEPASHSSQAVTQTARPESQLSVPQGAEDLNRIRDAVNRDPILRVDESQVRFYLQILGPRPSFWDFAKNADLKDAPVAGAQMTHREFLDMVTPKELYSAAGIRPVETLQMALTGLVGQILAKKAFESITDTWRARQLRQLNERIDSELAALRGRDK